jgi:hypothetical protein
MKKNDERRKTFGYSENKGNLIWLPQYKQLNKVALGIAIKYDCICSFKIGELV